MSLRNEKTPDQMKLNQGAIMNFCINYQRLFGIYSVFTKYSGFDFISSVFIYEV